MIRSLKELDRIRDECKSMVTRQSLVSAGAAAVPVPGVDVAVDLGLLSSMLPDVSKRFGLDHEAVSKLPPHLAEKLLVIVTSLGNNFIGKRITQELVVTTLKRIGVRVATKSVTKYIPFVGSAVAATISFGAMKLVGNGHVDDCYKVAKQLLDQQEPPELAAA